MSKNILYIVRLEDIRKKSRGSDSKIADYILSNRRDVANMTLMELADSTKTGYATVCRFFKRLGISGFKEFKKIFSEETENTDTAPDLDLVTNIDTTLDFDEVKKRICEYSASIVSNCGRLISSGDLEKVAACEPDIIFIGGRLSSVYADLEALAPVVYLEVDYEKGIVESTKSNAQTIASIFGKEAEVDALFTDFQPRIDNLKKVLNGKDVLLGMYNANALGLMDTKSQLNLIAKELGANNLGETVGEVEKATHGEEASWETIITLNPEYMFILDRSTATGAAEDGVMGAREVIENDLIKELDVYKDGKIVYFIEHANVWYTSTGGVKALDTMLDDLEEALLK